jgi:transposase
MYPDTDLGENTRHGEVFDEQAETYVFPGVQTAGGMPGAGSRYSHMEASRSVGIGESVLRRWVRQLESERQGITPQSKAMTPDQRAYRNSKRIERLEREKSILKRLPRS